MHLVGLVLIIYIYIIFTTFEIHVTLCPYRHFTGHLSILVGHIVSINFSNVDAWEQKHRIY